MCQSSLYNYELYIHTFPSPCYKLNVANSNVEGELLSKQCPHSNNIQQITERPSLLGKYHKNLQTSNIWSPQHHGFFHLFMFCLLFPLPFFPSALNPAPITNSHGIDLNRSFKICSEAGPSCCYTGSMEKRQTPEHGNNFHKQRQFSQQNGNLIRNLPLCILEMHLSIG